MIFIKNKTPQAKEVEQKIKENDGFCCCAVKKEKDTICICKDFRDKLADPAFYGECNCGLYTKIKSEEEI